jgi:hypothetical protein
LALQLAPLPEDRASPNAARIAVRGAEAHNPPCVRVSRGLMISYIRNIELISDVRRRDKQRFE